MGLVTIHSVKQHPQKSPASPKMLLILPVKSVLAFAAVGMSSYSFLMFLATLSPLEIQFLCAILNVITAGMAVCAIFHFFPEIAGRLEKVERMLEMEDSASEVSATSATSATSSVTDYTILERNVEEKDGKLYITTVLGPADGELEELIESPSEPELTEETTEFADLLNEEKKTN